MTTSLSAQIAALEERVQVGEAARELEGQLQARLDDLQQQLAGVRKTIFDGEYAGRILEHVSAQVARVLSGGEIMQAAAQPFAQAASESQNATLSTLVDIAPLTASDDDCAALLSTLGKIGYPVPSSALLTRLKHLGFDQHRVGVIAAELVNRREIVRQLDGKYALPTWRKK